MVAGKLRKIEFFKQFAIEEIISLASFVEYIELKEGAILFEEGAVCRDLYFVIEGRFNVLLKDAGADDIKDSNLVSTLKKGEIIGELSFLDGAPRSATVQVRNAAKIIKLPYEELSKYFELNPVSAFKIIQKISIMLAARVRSVNLMWRNNMSF